MLFLRVPPMLRLPLLLLLPGPFAAVALGAIKRVLRQADGCTCWPRCRIRCYRCQATQAQLGDGQLVGKVVGSGAGGKRQAS